MSLRLQLATLRPHDDPVVDHEWIYSTDDHTTVLLSNLTRLYSRHHAEAWKSLGSSDGDAAV